MTSKTVTCACGHAFRVDFATQRARVNCPACEAEFLADAPPEPGSIDEALANLTPERDPLPEEFRDALAIPLTRPTRWLAASSARVLTPLVFFAFAVVYTIVDGATARSVPGVTIERTTFDAVCLAAAGAVALAVYRFPRAGNVLLGLVGGGAVAATAITQGTPDGIPVVLGTPGLIAATLAVATLFAGAVANAHGDRR
jgi:hypothetical protein